MHSNHRISAKKDYKVCHVIKPQVQTAKNTYYGKTITHSSQSSCLNSKQCLKVLIIFALVGGAMAASTLEANGTLSEKFTQTETSLSEAKNVCLGAISENEQLAAKTQAQDAEIKQCKAELVVQESEIKQYKSQLTSCNDLQKANRELKRTNYRLGQQLSYRNLGKKECKRACKQLCT